jgi:cytochrome b561
MPMNPVRYSPLAIGLHWLIALMILGSFSVGLYMADLPFSPQKLKIYSWHKWAGVTIFMLVAVRCVWRLFHAAPAMPAQTPLWQQRVATATHYLLYVLMFAIPLSGWLMSSAKGFQTVYFAVLPIPDLLQKNIELGDKLRDLHELLNWLMLSIVAMHAAAAFKHHFFDRDDVLKRMLPAKRVRPLPTPEGPSQ